MSMHEHIASFGFTPAAESFICTIWDLIQFFDDVEDKDPVQMPVHEAVTLAMVRLPMNQFYQQWMATLSPAITLAIEKWQMSNEMEAYQCGDARSFMWRAAFYDVLANVCIIEGKPVRAALALYGEQFETYLQEVNNA